MSLSEQMKDFRKKHFLTTREAASLFGISPAEVSRIESAKNEPHLVTVARWEQKFAETEKRLSGNA